MSAPEIYKKVWLVSEIQKSGNSPPGLFFTPPFVLVSTEVAQQIALQLHNALLWGVLY